jgi:serine/threonine-protein kinase RsbT
MLVERDETLGIASESDIVVVRQTARAWSAEAGFSLVEQTKMVTAASELARNVLVHGGGGQVRLEAVANGSRRGLRMEFSDQGPGIADIAQALRDGYTTGTGLGLGLGGAKRLVNEFSLESTLGAGTRVVITRWK